VIYRLKNAYLGINVYYFYRNLSLEKTLCILNSGEQKISHTWMIIRLCTIS